MKILGINCSPRKGQTTYAALEKSLAAAQSVDGSIDIDLIELGDLDIRSCRGCGGCKKALSCPIEDDFASLIPTLADKDVGGMIIATPVYFGSMTGLCKAFIDRCAMFRRNGWLFRDRIAGVLAVGGVRNGGQELTIQAVQSACFCHDMICVSDGKPTAHFGGALWSGSPDGIENDAIGLETACNMGRRVAELACRLQGESI